MTTQSVFVGCSNSNLGLAPLPKSLAGQFEMNVSHCEYLDQHPKKLQLSV